MNNPILNACLYPLPALPETTRAKRSIGAGGKLWTTGQTLLISFVDTPPSSLKHTIFDVAQQWTKYANLFFTLVGDNEADAHIRIKTDGPAQVNQSYLGTAAMRMEGPSMWLAVKPDDEDFKTVVLHEFGHALGMDHEHQHPDARISWNLENIRKQLENNASDEQRQTPDIEEWLDNTIKVNILPMELEPGSVVLPYDPTSIMHYGFPSEMILEGDAIPLNTELSEKDKAFMRQVYPRN